ncbi:MAG TPA: regulatory iron-sulfur-containing complex subunit RicT, partial [Clostridia bacterium]|nr:regulatory iron-sulfur-containing complex subunit RicT [Clostridia bacterium]
MKCTVVGVRFKQAGKVYYFDPGNCELQLEDDAIVETIRGIEYGTVVAEPRQVAEEELVNPLRKVIRKATEADARKYATIGEKEEKAFKICLDRIAAHKLPMKLVNVEQTFDGNKIIFYFTADGRIDFRELVKD